MMIKNCKRIFFIVIILAIIFYVYYTFPRRLEKNYNAIEYRLSDDGYQREVFIQIDGWYTRKIFSSNYFQGSMTIDNTKFSKLKLYTQKRWPLFGFNENTCEYDSYGIIYSGNRLEEFIIHVYEEGDEPGSKQYGLTISAPSANRKEAITLHNRLVKNILDKE